MLDSRRAARGQPHSVCWPLKSVGAGQLTRLTVSLCGLTLGGGTTNGAANERNRMKSRTSSVMKRPANGLAGWVKAWQCACATRSSQTDSSLALTQSSRHIHSFLSHLLLLLFFASMRKGSSKSVLESLSHDVLTTIIIIIEDAPRRRRPHHTKSLSMPSGSRRREIVRGEVERGDTFSLGTRVSIRIEALENL